MQELTKPIISVIIPVYNVEKYLKRCLDSIVNQTLKEIEIICVNDGSTDSSLNILEEYAQKDARIKIINKPNGGLPSAWNAGLETAEADFITFVDSDDWINNQTFKLAYNAMIQNDVDFVYWSADIIFEYNNDNVKKIMENYFSIKYKGLIQIEPPIIDNTPATVWSKLYKKQIIKDNNIKFHTTSGHADCLFWAMYAPCCKTGYYIAQKLYNYIQRQDSITGKRYLQTTTKIFDNIILIPIMIEYYNTNNLTKKYYDLLLKNIKTLFFIDYNYNNQKNKEEVLNKISNDLKQIKLGLLKKDKFIIDLLKKNIQDNKQRYTLAQRVFSVKNEDTHKIISLLGLQIKQKRIKKSFKNKKLAVILHIYYHEQTDFIIEKLKNINGIQWDLFVTYSTENQQTFDKIKKLKPDTKFLKVKNLGYDVWPFVFVINSINLDDYDYVLKLHTKGYRREKLWDGTGYYWRDTLFNAILGSKKIFRYCLTILSTLPDVGMIGAKRMICKMTSNYPEETYLYNEICKKLGIKGIKGEFISGTIFICKKEIIQEFKKFNLQENDFPQYSQTDSTGTISHVLERLFGTMATLKGYRIYGMKEYIPFSKRLKKFMQNIFSIKNGNKNNRKIKRLVLLGIKLNLTQFKKDLNISLYKIQKPFRKAKTVCYTCITGNYAQLYSHDYINYSWDYICFTDNKNLLKKKQIGIWQIRPLVFNKLDNTKNNRWHKMHPHILFPDYEQSLYVDGNVNILTPYYSKLIAQTKLNMLLPKHYKNDCVYQELDYIVELNKETKEKIDVLRNKYRQEQMPEKLGLTENNIIFRKHKEPQIIKIMEEWWQMVENYSKRDQASFMYVIWKNGIDISKHTFQNARYDYKNCELQKQNYPVMGKNILITGGAGFIGSTLADRLLKEANKVVVIDNFNNYYDPQIKENNVKDNINNENYKLYRGDIEDIDFVEKVFEENSIDMVVHIAARAGVRPSLENPLAYTKTNVEGTVNILEAIRKHDVKKIVFASSSSVYGNCKAEKFSEDLKVTEPISPYAATKSACEQFLYTYSKLYDMQALCLRFFTVFGPRQRPDLAIRKFIELIEQDKPIPVYGDGTTMRDYTYIDDIVEGVMSALKYNASQYEIINLGGGAPVTLNGMIETIEKVLDKKAQIDRLPMQPGDVDKTVSDITKAQKLLGYCPQTTFEEGIRKFVEWRKKCN